ncbi:MAG: hypothetical protein IJY12_04840 [Clostridia bacterium]|nr:hypothetical protein [Clostridia bacterium]
MKNARIVQAVGDIDEALVEAAATAKKRNPLRRWGAIAACLAVLLMAGSMIVPLLGGESSSGVWVGGLARPYKGITVTPSESGLVWRWEERAIFEQYTSVLYNGQCYRARGREVDASLLGDTLGTVYASGSDDYFDTIFHCPFEAYAVAGASEELLVAVELDGAYYVFIREEAVDFPTLDDWMDACGFEHTVTLTRFGTYVGYSEQGYYTLAEDAYIMQILAACREAERVNGDAWEIKDKNYIEFTVTSEALGVYKKVLYISEDGYLCTNIMDYSYLYDIGEEAADAILSYAKEHGQEAEREPYTYTLAGTLTAIEYGYSLVDDSILCEDPEDGMVFKVLISDIRIRRYVERGIVTVGDTVVIEFTDVIDTEAGNVIDSAYKMSAGILADGSVVVPE